MQTDMHYYGTYAIARLAGFDVTEAKTIAYAAQYVDDSTSNDSDEHSDGGLIYGIATAHHNSQVVKNRLIDIKEQKRVWIPFHFLPGGEGETVSEKLLCRKNSAIANEMFAHHSLKASDSIYGLHLMGIASHVYTDTFSHYGFSGASSSENKVNVGSIKLLEMKDEGMSAFLTTKFGRFMKKYAPSIIMKNWRRLAGNVADKASGSLGHGGVGTYPDRPFLHWSFQYDGSDEVFDRNNPETFLEGCEALYKHLITFGKLRNPDHKPLREFDEVKPAINKILRVEAVMEDRIALWCNAIRDNELYPAESDEALAYDHLHWEKQKVDFPTLAQSADAVDLDVYKFHQAAVYHRYYVLKDLLPRHGIVVF